MRPFSGLALSLALASGAALAQQPGPSLSADDYRRDALSIDPLIAANYAYLDRFPNGRAPTTPRLQAEAEAVHDAATLLLYAERRLALLADPHAITGRSFSDSWAIVPSYADLWIEPEGDIYRITAIGLDALGARVTGCPMAGLLGAIYDFPLERSSLTIKLPAERLSTVSGVPREAFRCSP